MTQTETIIWFPYPNKKPYSMQGKCLVTLSNGDVDVAWWNFPKESFGKYDDKVVAFASKPIGWKDDTD
jgi:hypothetical protein